MASTEDLPADLLLKVLVLLSMKDLTRNCRLVCRWRQSLADLPVLWKRKYEQKGKVLETRRPLLKDSHLFYHLERNLIKNPCGEEGLSFWDIKVPQDGQWKTKELFGTEALTYRAKENFRRNRFLEKEDISYEEIKKCFVASDGAPLQGKGEVFKDFKVVKEMCSEDMFETEPKTEHWYQHSHIFDLGIRHILFEHQGRCVNGKPSGDSGVKTAQSCVTLDPYCLE